MKLLFTSLKERRDGYELYNILEQAILDREIDPEKLRSMKISQEEITHLLREIKKVAIMLQRNRPADWNTLLETAMGLI